MLHLALYEPEIPPNTGNIIRLCANSGTQLQLIHPLGFSLTDKQCRRAGLDYHEYTNIIEHDNYEKFKDENPDKRIIACSTKGKIKYSELKYQTNDVLLFGPETRGLPATVLNEISDHCIIRIPMLANSRSLNLSNASAIILYEAWRQLGFGEMT